MFNWSQLENLNINRLVPFYLMSCFLYYELDVNVLSDNDYNMVCKRLYNEFDSITHMHKYMLDKDSLKASTALGIKYTDMIKKASEIWYKEYLKYTN